MSKIAAVLVRGTVRVNHGIKLALHTLKLRRRHACVILEDTPANLGLLRKCKDYITYGPVKDATIEAMKQRMMTKNGKPTNVYRMHPPRGGYERKGIKVSYQEGGALGLRAETMDAFLTRMI